MRKLIPQMGAVAGGTVAGQLCVMAVTPALTRFYEPDQVGYFTLFASCVGLLSTTASLHYELAIPLPSSAKQSSAIAALALFVSFAQSLIVALLLPFLCFWLFGRNWESEIGWASGWWPLSLVLSGFSGVLVYVAIREKRFGAIGVARGLQGAVQASCQFLSGVLELHWTWLIGSQVVGVFAGILALVRPNKLWAYMRMQAGIRYLLVVARRYAAFPLATTPSSLLNALMYHLPPIFLAWGHGPAAAAMYGIAMRILLVPSRFLSQAVSQVLLGDSADAVRSGELPKNITAMSVLLFKISCHIFVPIVLIAESLFRILLGAEWTESAIYAQCLSPWLLVSFISTPLSMLVTVLGQQRRELHFQAIFVFTLGASMLSGVLFQESVISVAVLGALAALLSSAKVWWLLKIAGCGANTVMRAAGRELLIVSMVYLPLLAVPPAWGDWVVLALAAPMILLFELYSIRIRRIYA